MLTETHLKSRHYQSKPWTKREKHLESHLLPWVRLFRETVRSHRKKHSGILLDATGLWLNEPNSVWGLHVSLFLTPNSQVVLRLSWFIYPLVSAFPSFRLTHQQLWLPQLAVLFGLSCGRMEAWKGRNSLWEVVDWATGAVGGAHPLQGEAPGLCLRLPREDSLQGQRSPCFIAPGCVVLFHFTSSVAWFQ